MSTGTPTKPSNASLTQLPPSPDLKSASIGAGNELPDLSLDATLGKGGLSSVLSTVSTPIPAMRRLMSVAKYQAFHPQALACSNILTTSFNDEDDSPGSGVNNSASQKVASTTLTSTNTATPKEPAPSSLGAIAGPQGVALFRLSRPHAPLLILSHASSASKPRNSISSLAFQPSPFSHTDSNLNGRYKSMSTTRALYLAAARGSGVLVWDASGHSHNPLIGRLGMEQLHTHGDMDTRITSISWMPTMSSPLLATTTASSFSLWDLRSSSYGPSSTLASNRSNHGSVSNGATGGFKPSLRFGTARKSISNMSPVLLQVACSSDTEECATIDASGIVRVYDIRMTERSRSSPMGSPVSTFLAHEAAGVGISYFSGSTSDSNSSATSTDNDAPITRWLTWGLESPHSSAIVKVWSNESLPQLAETNLQDSEDYWYMGGEGSSSPLRRSSNRLFNSEYHLVGQCVRPDLACARVCSSPVSNTVLAIGHISSSSDPQTSGAMYSNIPPVASSVPDQNGWWAELLTLSDDIEADSKRSLTSEVPKSFGLTSIAKFHGGSATASLDKKALFSVLGGRVNLGRLQAAELAYSGGSLDSRTLRTDDQELQGDTGRKDTELLLCCLSDTGIVTTHLIPEALPKSGKSKASDLTRDGSPKRAMGNQRSNFLRTGFLSSTQTRVYPEDREGNSLADAAAGYWGGSNIQTGNDAGQFRADENRFVAEVKASSPQKKSESEDAISGNTIRRVGDGGFMPFDIDVPVAYGSVTTGNMNNLQIGITDMASGTVVSSTGMGVVEEGEPVAGDVRDSTSIMENIDTERVPCPPLCGATFGMGNGGLVIFHNGEVKKMWNWYQRTNTIRLTGNPGLSSKADTSTNEPDTLRTVHKTSNPLAPEVEETKKANQTVAGAGPRTLKELVNMMTTAKEAQWGERNGSDGSESDDELSTGDNFFEDESSGSDGSESDDDEAMSPPPAEEIYKRYFGGRAWKGTVEKIQEPSSPSRQGTNATEVGTQMRPFVGPSSDTLAPVVRVTHAYDAMILNHQSVDLAQGWKLGKWAVQEEIEVEEPSLEEEEILEESVEEEEDDDRLFPRTKPIESDRGALGTFGFHKQNPSTGKTIPRTKSDSNIGMMKLRKSSPSYKYVQDEPGVHGGEYSVRPNMEESMTFLKKLFTHQQEGGAGFQNLLSPPDSPVLLHSFSTAKRPSSTGHLRRLKLPLGQGRSQMSRPVEVHSANLVTRPGVYTIRQDRKDSTSDLMKELSDIKNICLHNASVCKEVGKVDKEDVWNLLAQTVDGVMDDEGKDFNGWGGSGGGALGVDLVSNLLKYYEALGDVQMLATMYCVLSGGRRGDRIKNFPYLLPQGNEEKYDAYIKRYAELLYGWGLLSVRAEVNKHLIRIPLSEIEVATTIDDTPDGAIVRSPGIAVVFECPRCGRDGDFNTNVCRACNDYVFRCSLCDNAVRGLFTVCDICGHGGHVEHIKSWFANNVKCPTGCGCNCKFAPLMPKSSDVAA